MFNFEKQELNNIDKKVIANSCFFMRLGMSF